MNLLKKYDIDISKLNIGRYDHSFQIDDSFFELFDHGIVDQGDIKVDLTLEKTVTFIKLTFRIGGTIKLICDRSLDEFDYKLSADNELILRYGEEAKELSDEIEIIPFNTLRINVGKYIYEYISVAVPMKKLHPRYADESQDDQIIYSSEDDFDDASDIDPRWSELKKLKHKDKN